VDTYQDVISGAKASRPGLNRMPLDMRMNPLRHQERSFCASSEDLFEWIAQILNPDVFAPNADYGSD